MAMNLSGVNGRNAYSTGAAAALGSASKNVRAELGHAKNLDTIEISRKARPGENSGLAKAIANELAGLDNTQRINHIKEEIAKGTYQVSAADVAAAVLGEGILI